MEQEPIEYTKYEKARMIGSRALQISMGAPIMIEITDAELEKIGFNPIEIAKREFEAGVIPLTIRRPLPGQRKKEEEKNKEK